METLLQDIRYGVRVLLKSPGISLVAIIALALGIGANTAIFSVVNSVLLRPLPYRNADGLVMIWGNFQKLGIKRLAAKSVEYEDYRAQDQIFEAVAAFENQSFNAAGASQAERLTGARVTANLFSMIGAQPVQGRGISVTETEATRDNVVVLSYAFAERRYGSSAGALGQLLKLDDQDYTVVGVMPASFQFPHPSFPFSEPADLWLPLISAASQIGQREGPYHLNVMARLRPNVTLSQARSQMETLARSFENQYRGYRGPHGEDGGWQITLAPLQEEVVGNSRRALLLLSGAVAFVLLIACANVANLSLVRAASRQKELAIRLALGASRKRILRQLLIESLLLALVGGFVGLLLAFWGVSSLAALGSANLPRLAEVNIDFRVLGFTTLVTILSALFFGLAPAWQASKFDFQRTLKENRPAAVGAWRYHYWRNLLLVSEIALSLVLLVGAGLLVKSFLHLQQIKPAIATGQLMTGEIELPKSRYQEANRVRGFYRELVSRLEGLPGVQAVSLGTARPLSGVTVNDPFAIEGRPLDPHNISFAGWQEIGPKYFQALEIPLIQGRDVTPRDAESAAPPVAVINQSMAARYWPGENPIGKRISLGLPGPNNPWVTIVGIAKDLPHRLDAQSHPDWYLSRPHAPNRHQIIFVRSAMDFAALTASIRLTVASLDPSQPVTNIQKMSDVVAATLAPRRFNMSVLTIFAALALALAALGIYGVTAYAVAQRTHEIGIRMALGAQRSNVLMLVIKNALLLTLAGITIGLLIAFLLTRLMSALLFEVSPTDVTTFAVVSLVFVLAALLASYLPARRATRVDPLVALRYE